ncbi:Fe-S cluster biogenesis protein NfuA [Sporomusaceae bacterium BoRhaA]|uniref:NifU family protein n=1 Tax=Pelorhabdus rhamnosifermentans TaxID=2772457 RepID=UPI001C062221|nr:NifU family protein [Pelorhabdus rhamnosifermentans]MBU2700283.1 Fe-S cluster biogenesis protein NfuA [Pelorhabdus rhamnosifermentans]
MNRIEQIIEEKIRPILQSHEGDIEYLDTTEDGFVRVRLTGACSICPGAQQTLKEVVETILRAECPEIQGVVPVFEVIDELIQQALEILRQGKPS